MGIYVKTEDGVCKLSSDLSTRVEELEKSVNNRLKYYRVYVSSLTVPGNNLTRVKIQSKADFDKGLTTNNIHSVAAIVVLDGTYGDQMSATACLYNGELWLQVDSRYSSELTINPSITVMGV